MENYILLKCGLPAFAIFTSIVFAEMDGWIFQKRNKCDCFQLCIKGCIAPNVYIYRMYNTAGNPDEAVALGAEAA